ncbi:MAG: hypothetical protein A2586_00340 [Candidatus Harrisonbacteria bacterium RIFOXYD1_FULL_40_9]|uniref:Uncharacterized protein n=1 Tax=Candidatus Harrisonbacteria bacterium RIFOXYD1_FULL_40_9 TaxID=1798412 RepID=A0A1G1ZY50_9BACT|nr:MAG: hypothetical protein A2586_00340 [Candidatus Harrisonbacteria bacterium RIFOXYD1_FULL_40_9]
MIKQIKHFVVTLQESSEDVKKMWLWILSGTTVVFIIALWVVYINAVIGGVTPERGDSNKVSNEEEQGVVPSLSGTLRNSFSKASSLKTALLGYIGGLTGARFIEVRRLKPDFVLDGLEKVPYQKLSY